jgi:hypothetical protein
MDMTKRAMLVVAMLACVPACDPGGKSVTATAEEGGESEGSSSGEEGSSTATTTGIDPSATSEETGDPEPDVPACLETATDLEAEEDSPLGFSGTDILLEARSFEQTFTISDDTGSIVIAGAGVPTQLSLTIGPGPSRYIESVENPEYIDFNPQGCQSRFEMDVRVVFDTADGRFAEVFEEALLVAYDVSTFEWSQRVAPDGFTGTFSEADISYENATGMLEYFELRGQVTGLESTGTLWGMGILDPEELDEDLAYAGTFGSWSD